MRFFIVDFKRFVLEEAYDYQNLTGIVFAEMMTFGLRFTRVWPFALMRSSTQSC